MNLKVRDQVYQQRNNGITESSLGKFSRLQQREGKPSSARSWKGSSRVQPPEGRGNG